MDLQFRERPLQSVSEAGDVSMTLCLLESTRSSLQRPGQFLETLKPGPANTGQLLHLALPNAGGRFKVAHGQSPVDDFVPGVPNAEIAAEATTAMTVLKTRSRRV